MSADFVLPETVPMGSFASTIMNQKYAEPGEDWVGIARRVVDNVMRPRLPELADEMTYYIAERKFMPGGRYLYASGKPFHQTQNCLLLKVGDSREEIADLFNRVGSGLMTGAGIGIVWSGLRSRNTHVGGMGGTSTGPTAFMQAVNEIGRNIMQGGARRSAIWGGLHWSHLDVFEFIALKDWPEEIVAMKAKDFNAAAPMDMTNISVILDDDFFAAMEDEGWSKEYQNGDSGSTYTIDHDWAQRIYWTVVEKMLATGEPGFSIDVGENAGEHLRNACTEVTSADDNDICNLGSINLARVESLDEMKRITQVATAFLLCGTEYSLVPYQGVADTREKNRRLGLGLMGMYDWLAIRGKTYGPDEELGVWLQSWKTESDTAALVYAQRLGVRPPLKKRAIAPTGTIGILAEVAGTGVEPLFAVAMKRRYLKGTEWHFQYVIDAAAQRLIDQGVDPTSMETAYELAKDPERRLAFQAWVQQYVDHGISSTLNLPSPSEQTHTYLEFGDMLLKYLPQVRGVTVYPDGARGGQPLTVVPYEEAAGQVGLEFAEYGNENVCVGGVCGI